MSQTNSTKELRMMYSIVIPIYNEEQIIHELYTRLTNVMKRLTPCYEIIFVNDGSDDNTLKTLKHLNSKDHRIKIVNLSRNFGQQIAIAAGIDHSQGEAVIIMDADLQDPPEVLPQFIEKKSKGYEVVYGVRKKRKERLLKRMAYTSFYRILKKIADVSIPLDSGDFCIIDRKIINLLKAMPERNRFIRGIRSWVGFRQTGLEYNRDKRYAGDVKYTNAKLVKLALDGFISFSHKPLRISSYLGFFVSTISFLGILITFYLKLFTNAPLPGFTTIVTLILFLGGIQLITIGIIGEYLGRIYDEVKQRPLYITDGSIGFDNPQTDKSKQNEDDF